MLATASRELERSGWVHMRERDLVQEGVLVVILSTKVDRTVSVPPPTSHKKGLCLLQSLLYDLNLVSVYGGIS